MVALPQPFAIVDIFLRQYRCNAQTPSTVTDLQQNLRKKKECTVVNLDRR